MEMRNNNLSKATAIKLVIVYFLLFLAGDLFSSLAFDLIFLVVELPIRGLYFILRILGCLLLTYFLFLFYTVKVLHLEMSDFRITCSIKKWAILYAIILPVFVVLCFLIVGEWEITGLTVAEISVAILYSVITALKAGILEEMLFRGYIMKLLEENWNKSVAILPPSFLFSLAHIPSMEVFSVAGILPLIVSGTLVGIMFSLITYKGNSTSNSSVLHSVWNFILVTDTIHITTSQATYGEPIFSIIIPSGNMLVTGGGFGVEASIIAIIGYLLVCSAVIFWKKDNGNSA